MSDAVDLSEAKLLADAVEGAGGLTDFGDERFREGLRVLLDTYEKAALKPGGRKRTRGRIVQLLVNRLKIEQAFKDHPEIRERRIEAPVYLTGLPRTGTSALFNLLGVDPASRPLLLWEGIFPDPLGKELGPGEEDPRLVGLRAYYDHMKQKDPEFDAIHFVDADGPEECVLLLAHAFCDVQMGVEPLLSPFREFFESADLRPSYAYYLDLLRLLDWQRPGERWLLKSPAHLWALDALVEQTPDACIIQTHRDPVEILGSYCSMIEALMAICESVDKEKLGASVLEHLARALERGMSARDTGDDARFFDLDYRRFVSDPISAVTEVYGYFGLPLGDATLGAMREYVASHPQRKHGKHEYSLEEYGLSPESIRERLGFYLDRFNLASVG
jgi:hypothetical protein